MGSFNHKCNFSQLPAKYGDRIVVLVGVQQTTNTLTADNFSPGNSFTPVSVPIRGIYDDYGSITDIDRTSGVEALEKFFGMSVKQIVDCAERNTCGCRNQVEDDYEKIMTAIKTVSSYTSDDIEFSYIMEHESVFDNMLSMSNVMIKDRYHWQIPHECMEELGYSKKIIGKERAYDVIIWSHTTLPELKETCYIWKTSDFGDYGKVCHTIQELCDYIGCEVPEKFSELYYESRFKADIDFLAEKEKNSNNIEYIFRCSSDEHEYSFISFANYGLFSGYNGSIPSSYLICSLGKTTLDEHLKPEFMKEVIEVALLYETMYSLQMTWNNTNYYSQDIEYSKHIQFLENCLETAKQKNNEYNSEE